MATSKSRLTQKPTILLQPEYPMERFCSSRQAWSLVSPVLVRGRVVSLSRRLLQVPLESASTVLESTLPTKCSNCRTTRSFLTPSTTANPVEQTCPCPTIRRRWVTVSFGTCLRLAPCPSQTQRTGQSNGCLTRQSGWIFGSRPRMQRQLQLHLHLLPQQRGECTSRRHRNHVRFMLISSTSMCMCVCTTRYSMCNMHMHMRVSLLEII